MKIISLEICHSSGDLCNNDINKDVKDICTVCIFTNAAQETFGRPHFSQMPTKKVKNRGERESVNQQENIII